jgi:coenzyme F420 hydrogenase subunit beta
MVQSFILTSREEELLPKGKIVAGREEILGCAGSSYVSGPTLEALNRGPWKDQERIGVVGLPCQVLALTKMRTSSLKKKTPVERVGLVIGLFCTWALEYKPFMTFLDKQIGSRSIEKLNISPPPERVLEVVAEGELHQIPVDGIRPYIRPSCQVCLDMTAELSDISVGTVEGIEGWNTVMVRTEMGEDLLRQAVSSDVIETQILPKDHLNHLKEASLLKKRRALNVLKEKGGIEKAYFALSTSLIKRILSETEETP